MQINANTLLRTLYVINMFSQSMVAILKHYKYRNLNIASDTYDSFLKYIEAMDQSTAVMNDTRNKGCELLNSSNGRPLFELLDVVKFHTLWKIGWTK